MSLPFLPELPSVDALWAVISDPRRLHAAMVHVPIALALVLPLGMLTFLCLGGRSHVGRWSLVVAYGLAAVCGWYAAESGEMAVQYEHAPASRSVEALELIELHERFGDVVPMILAGCAVLLVLTAIPGRAVRLTFLLLSLAASLGAAGWVGVTAHYGGELVYQHGVNTPATVNNAPPPPALVPGRDATTGVEKGAPNTADAAPDPPRQRGFFGIPSDQ